MIAGTARRRGDGAPSGGRHAVGRTTRRRGDGAPSGGGKSSEGRHDSEKTDCRRVEDMPTAGRNTDNGGGAPFGVRPHIRGRHRQGQAQQRGACEDRGRAAATCR